MPVLVTSLEPGSKFSEVCETLVVSAHGCAMRSPVKLGTGVPMYFRIKDGREAKAHVVDCQPLGSDRRAWSLAARLDQPENFWGLSPCPEDWVRLPDVAAAGDQAAVLSSNKAATPKMPMLRAVVAELVEPLQAEIADLRTQLSGGTSQRSSFEVSLSHIPPELEEKLWMRLRQDLGAQVMQQTHEQAEQVLSATQAAIEQKIEEVQDEFRHRAVQQLQAVEERAQALSGEIADEARQGLRAGLDDIQQEVVQAAGRFERQGEELLRALQQRLQEEQEAHRREVQQVQTTVASESSRLRSQLAELGNRVAQADESARRLESDVDGRLARLANDTLSSARAQMDDAAGEILSAQLARLNAEVNAKLVPLLKQSESVIADVRFTTDSLRVETDRANQQVAAVREEKERFQQWLAEQSSAYKSELHGQLEREIYEAAAAAGAQLENSLKASLSAHLDRARGDLNTELERLLERARSLEKTLVQETGAWLAEQSLDFRKAMQATLADSSAQIKERIEQALSESATRNANELGDRLDEATARLKNIQDGVAASMSESLSTEVAQTLRSFEKSVEEVAQNSVGRWRLALARDLGSVADMLGGHFRSAIEPNGNEKH